MASSAEEEFSDVETIAKKFKNILEKKGIAELRKEVGEDLERWQNTKINIAVTGASGAGKSTFINRILDLNEEDAAPTGITETTMVITSYTAKNHPNVVFWDLPGVGTPNFPRDEYVQRVNLKRYDFFILLTRNRFSENDVWLANQIQQIGKGFFLVRSHVSQDIRNYSKAHPKCTDPCEPLSAIRHGCEHTFKKESETVTVVPRNFAQIRVYLIDSFKLSEFDFNKLVDDLVKLADGVKSHLLVLAFSSATQEIIDKKLQGLLRRIQYVSMQAGLNCKVETAESVIKDVFVQESKYYREVFEIDDETLKSDPELFRLTSLSVELVKTKLKKIDKRLIQAHVKRFRKCIELFKDKFKTNFDDLEPSSKNYIKIISDILLLYMTCMYRLATNLFQNMPKQIMKKY